MAKRFIKTLKKQNSFEALGDNGNYDVFPIACIPTESEEDADWDNALSNKTYRVSFNVAGSIVMTASSSDMAEKMVMEGIRGEDSSMMQDIAAILQNHLAHADVSIDEVEEKDDDE